MSTETNTEIKAETLQVGDLLYDRLLGGTHGAEVKVWR